MKNWRLRFALGVVSALLAACGSRAGDPIDIALGHGTHFCMSVTQTLTACLLVTRLDAQGRHLGTTANDTQARSQVHALRWVDPSV